MSALILRLTGIRSKSQARWAVDLMWAGICCNSSAVQYLRSHLCMLTSLDLQTVWDPQMVDNLDRKN
eukprot:6051549-Karenia_brevis.AAC.1